MLTPSTYVNRKIIIFIAFTCDDGSVYNMSQEHEVTNWPMWSGCFIALLLIIILFVFQILCTKKLPFLMGLINCLAGMKIEKVIVVKCVKCFKKLV